MDAGGTNGVGHISFGVELFIPGLIRELVLFKLVQCKLLVVDCGIWVLIIGLGEH